MSKLNILYFAAILGLVLFAIVGTVIKVSTPVTAELPACQTIDSHNCHGTNTADDGYAQNYVDIDGNTYYWEAK